MRDAPRLKKVDLLILKTLESSGYELPTLAVMDKLNDGKSWWHSYSYGTIHVSTMRLEENGYITSTLRPGGEERGFRPRRFLRLTGEGLFAARSAAA